MIWFLSNDVVVETNENLSVVKLLNMENVDCRRTTYKDLIFSSLCFAECALVIPNNHISFLFINAVYF